MHFRDVYVSAVTLYLTCAKDGIQRDSAGFFHQSCSDLQKSIKQQVSSMVGLHPIINIAACEDKLTANL